MITNALFLTFPPNYLFVIICKIIFVSAHKSNGFSQWCGAGTFFAAVGLLHSAIFGTTRRVKNTWNVIPISSSGTFIVQLRSGLGSCLPKSVSGSEFWPALELQKKKKTKVPLSKLFTAELRLQTLQYYEITKSKNILWFLIFMLLTLASSL